MTAPRWIAEAVDASISGGLLHPDNLAHQLLERLPIEAMIAAIAPLPSAMEAAAGLVMKIATVLAGPDGHDVVTMAELYQNATHALDRSGVPYAEQGEPPMRLEQRIRWLARQRPTRIELDREVGTMRVERDDALSRIRALNDLIEERAAGFQAERSAHDDARRSNKVIADDRDYWKALASSLQADLEAAAGEVLVSLDDMPPGSTLRRVVMGNRILHSRVAERDGEIRDLQAQLEERDARIAELTSENEELAATNTDLESALDNVREDSPIV